jgi:hypothetical protein
MKPPFPIRADCSYECRHYDTTLDISTGVKEVIRMWAWRATHAPFSDVWEISPIGRKTRVYRSPTKPSGHVVLTP